jgi:hypothetical protein
LGAQAVNLRGMVNVSPPQEPRELKSVSLAARLNFANRFSYALFPAPYLQTGLFVCTDSPLFAGWRNLSAVVLSHSVC